MKVAVRRYAVAIALSGWIARAAQAEPHVCLLDEGERSPRHELPGASCQQELALSALRGEHVAFQVHVRASSPVSDVQIALEGGPRELSFARYLAHFVEVRARSRTHHGPESLAFLGPAKPPDEDFLGWLPDALLPIEIAPSWAPYPATVTPAEPLLFFVEAWVPPELAAGRYALTMALHHRAGPPLRLPVTLDVAAHELPYRAVRAHAFYERTTLDRRFSDPGKVERELVQALHAHGLDSITQLMTEADAFRLAGSFDGSWFTEAEGYRGPGPGVGTSLAPLGAYGTLGDPSRDKLTPVAALRSHIPRSVEDVFLYAIDEQCSSPRGPGWRALFARADLDLEVGHTCHLPPRQQSVDLVMMPAQAFDPDAAQEGRAHGQKVWIYNGQLPFAGSMALDVPLTSLTANGWIAASFDVGRWFYWESIFWNDKNRGGHGPSDVFANAETFHNADGDAMLYDGLLFFPGRLPSGLGPHDLGVDRVLPSLRLKALRRGLEDAALLGLAASVDPDATYRISAPILGRVLDEVNEREPTAMDLRPASFARARTGLRALIAAGERPSAGLDATRGLAALRERRVVVRERLGLTPPGELARAVVGFFLPLGLFALGLAFVRALAEWRRPRA